MLTSGVRDELRPLAVSLQCSAVPHDPECVLRSSDRHVETLPLSEEADDVSIAAVRVVRGSGAGEDDDVFLSSLEAVDCRDLCVQ